MRRSESRSSPFSVWCQSRARTNTVDSNKKRWPRRTRYETQQPPAPCHHALASETQQPPAPGHHAQPSVLLRRRSPAARAAAPAAHRCPRQTHKATWSRPRRRRQRRPPQARRRQPRRRRPRRRQLHGNRVTWQLQRDWRLLPLIGVCHLQLQSRPAQLEHRDGVKRVSTARMRILGVAGLVN